MSIHLQCADSHGPSLTKSLPGANAGPSGTRATTDDEPDALELFAMVLKQYGAEVTAVASADEALDEIRQLKIDVLVSDIQMPVMDGYELISKVRALEAEGARRIPAIALTAYARTEDRMRSLLAGYQAHLSKPVESTELVAMVAALGGRTGQV